MSTNSAPPRHVPQYAPIKYRDTLPVLEVTLRTPSGAIVNLSGAGAVKLHIGLENRATRITKAMDIYNAALGIVRYTFVPTDWTDAPAMIVGIHSMEYEVIDSVDPTIRQTYPNLGHDYLIVTDDLGQG
jgi:hypothetical protein